MTEVFFCTVEPYAYLTEISKRTPRSLMRDLCASVWRSMPDDKYRWCYGEGIDGFQVLRRKNADAFSANDIYILTDDDMLPLGENFIARGIALMEKYPEFGILSALPTNAVIQEWNPENYIPISTEEVMEHHSVGGLRFCRKGIVKHWPDQTRKGYDTEHCQAIRDAGYRVGYMRNVRANHVGAGFSTIW